MNGEKGGIKVHHCHVVSQVPVRQQHFNHRVSHRRKWTDWTLQLWVFLRLSRDRV